MPLERHLEVVAAPVYITGIIFVFFFLQEPPFLLLIRVYKCGAFGNLILIRISLDFNQSPALHELRRPSLLIADSVVNHRPTGNITRPALSK